MVAHAAFGGSTNLLLHLPAIAYSAGLKRPGGRRLGTTSTAQVPRLVDALPNGPAQFRHRAGLPRRRSARSDAPPETRRAAQHQGEDRLRRDPRHLPRLVGEQPAPPRTAQEPDDPRRHRSRRRHHGSRSRPLQRPHPDGLFSRRQSGPGGFRGQEHVHRSVRDRTPTASFITSDRPGSSSPKKPPSTPSRTARSSENDVMVLVCGGPAGAGMEEIYQITSALKWLPSGKHVALLTDARFSGVSTGACIGHISPEALAGGAIGKLLDGDQIEIIIDREKLTGSVNLVGDARERFGAEEGARQVKRAAIPPRSPAPSRASRRHPSVGCAGPGQWRSLGRMRLRRRRHHLPAAASVGTAQCLTSGQWKNGCPRPADSSSVNRPMNHTAVRIPAAEYTAIVKPKSERGSSRAQSGGRAGASAVPGRRSGPGLFLFLVEISSRESAASLDLPPPRNSTPPTCAFLPASSPTCFPAAAGRCP